MSQLDEDTFDLKHAARYAELLEAGDYDALLFLCKHLLLTENPTPSMRVELLSGIAMSQVGLAAAFTEALKQQGLAIREEVGMTQDEATQVYENVKLCLQLKADGAQQVTYPDLTGVQDAKPE